MQGPETEPKSSNPPPDGGNGGAVAPASHPGGKTPELFDAVYDQLRDLAGRQMARERSDLTLQTTALVHEAYLRLMKDPEVQWDNPRHFFGAAAEAMRRILVERARRHAALKHGGGRRRLDLSAADQPGGRSIDVDTGGDAEAVIELDTALSELKEQDQRMSEVVMLRYFAGLSVEETAAATGSSARTVKRDWAFARAWLSKRLDGTAA
ncbi:MAG: sigma-70 family RNA polymerase sigma factor [Planctomycetota bacterium]